ncbi:MAG: hypothetical protein IJT44_01840 [Clostridia bacterium]|nr:hypothetical protein [Clostridia bacterium]
MTEQRKLILRLRAQLVEKEYVLCGIDGRSGAGKTALAQALQEEFGCTVIHLSDFPLRPEQRAPQRLREPGGSIDRERLLSEALKPLRARLPFCYRPYDAKAQTFGDPIPVLPGTMAVVEGVYACHPALRNFYDLRVFLDVDPDTQRERLRARDADEWPLYETLWLPAEERYFRETRVRDRCNLVLK